MTKRKWSSTKPTPTKRRREHLPYPTCNQPAVAVYLRTEPRQGRIYEVRCWKCPPQEVVL